MYHLMQMSPTMKRYLPFFYALSQPVPSRFTLLYVITQRHDNLRPWIKYPRNLWVKTFLKLYDKHSTKIYRSPVVSHFCTSCHYYVGGHYYGTDWYGTRKKSVCVGGEYPVEWTPGLTRNAIIILGNSDGQSHRCYLQYDLSDCKIMQCKRSHVALTLVWGWYEVIW
jgi:hypothetical protein